eukprot:8266438-Pyramimonas_sp.AAC.1
MWNEVPARGSVSPTPASATTTTLPRAGSAETAVLSATKGPGSRAEVFVPVMVRKQLLGGLRENDYGGLGP